MFRPVGLFSLESTVQNSATPADAAQCVVRPRSRRSQQAWFTKDDDDRLRAILEGRQFPLRYGEWGQVAKELGKFSGEQIREHYRSLGRRSQITAITLEESRDVVRRSVAQENRFRRVAQGIRVGRQRSPELVRMALTEIYERLKLLGFKVRTPEDADLLPDEVLRSGIIPPARAGELLREYNEAVARRTRESLPDGASEEARTLIP
jgi:hypothetical protein